MCDEAGSLSKQEVIHMKRIFLILFLAVGGCTSYYAVDISSEKEVAVLNKLARRHGTAVVFANGTVVKAVKLHVSPDTITWLDPMTDSIVRERSSRISEIRVNRTNRGVTDGLVVGSATGAGLLGIPVALAYAFDGGGGGYLSPDPTLASLSAAFGGLVGGLVGMGFGGAMGHTDIYSVNYDSPIPRLESHPKEK